MLRRTVSGLLEEGFVTVPRQTHGIPEALIADANEAMRELIMLLHASGDQCALVREGENEPDVLLIHRNGSNGKDLKFFLHYSSDLMSFPYMQERQKRISEKERFHWNTLGLLYGNLNDFSRRLLVYMYEHHRDLFVCDIVSGFDRSLQATVCGTTALRGLLYEARAGQKGAKPHFDRSLLSLHLGDIGGELLRHEGEETILASPEKGEISCFWGVKALLATNGAIKPVLHSSIASPTIDRQALVHFVHTDVGVAVEDAQAIYEAFHRNKQN